MVLYTKKECPLCTVAKLKLNNAGIVYEMCTDEATMESLGIDQLPVLILDDGTHLAFKQIVDYAEART